MKGLVHIAQALSPYGGLYIICQIYHITFLKSPDLSYNRLLSIKNNPPIIGAVFFTNIKRKRALVRAPPLSCHL